MRRETQDAAAPRRPRVRPLLARPGARFACHNDGFCCRDFYSLGPVGAGEARRLRLLAGDVCAKSGTRDYALRVDGDGVCVMLESGGCAIHSRYGFAHKPAVCRRFPYGLVATPEGGRIVTSHRCTCRTLGARPPLDVEEAVRSLSDASGRIAADARVGDALQLDERSWMSFRTYTELETALFAALAGGEPALDALGIDVALPAALCAPLAAFGAELVTAGSGPRRVHLAARWFGGALQSLATGAELVLEDPFGGPEFDRVMRRCAEPDSAGRMLSDWAADAVWSLAWRRFGSFERGRRELGLRLMCADLLTQARVRGGAREDRAAAEAILAVELASVLPRWTEVARQLPFA